MLEAGMRHCQVVAAASEPSTVGMTPAAACTGGEGATAREVLRHKSVEKVVMVDIDKVVCDFCHAHLEHNKAAFESPKLELINDDARAQLEQYPGKFDVIIGDLADPLEDGPCYQLYTQVGATEPSRERHTRTHAPVSTA
jgi:predicted membrane-bound spermidine synthase